MVSSDAVDVGSGRYALITYWERRSRDDLDFYRCVDITDSAFNSIRHDCWKALRPTGRAPQTLSDVTSSGDICGRPASADDADSIAFCAFSRSFVLNTPHFEMTLSPFENGGMVAVREQGRHLIVVDEDLPASVLLEVRADALADRELSGIASTQDLAGQRLDESQCAIDDFAGRQWAVCQPENASTTLVQYLIEADTVYQVSFNTDVSASDQATVQLMMQSFRPRSR